MRYNGLCLVIEMAASQLGSPLIKRYRQAILLGAIGHPDVKPAHYRRDDR